MKFFLMFFAFLAITPLWAIDIQPVALSPDIFSAETYSLPADFNPSANKSASRETLQNLSQSAESTPDQFKKSYVIVRAHNLNAADELIFLDVKELQKPHLNVEKYVQDQITTPSLKKLFPEKKYFEGFLMRLNEVRWTRNTATDPVAYQKRLEHFLSTDRTTLKSGQILTHDHVHFPRDLRRAARNDLTLDIVRAKQFPKKMKIPKTKKALLVGGAVAAGAYLLTTPKTEGTEPKEELESVDVEDTPTNP